MTPLCDLAFKHGSDKCPQIKHHYTEFYYELLKYRRGRVKKILEIGIESGASLRMWRDFFHNAQIYGIDVDRKTLFEEERIKTFLCDQRDGKGLIELIGKIGADFDLVVDDGSHSPDDQVFTCLTLMPLLNKKVIYAIEDTRNEIVKRLSEYDIQIKRRSKMLYSDDRLILVRHKDG